MEFKILLMWFMVWHQPTSTSTSSVWKVSEPPDQQQAIKDQICVAAHDVYHFGYLFIKTEKCEELFCRHF
jgi:hypothetical protein